MVSSKGASRFAIGSICHTDSAKAYKKLDSEEALPALYSGALGGPSFAHLKLAHGIGHKPPHPEFTCRVKLKVWDGRRWVHEISWTVSSLPSAGRLAKSRLTPQVRRRRQLMPWSHSFTSGCELSNFCVGSLSQTLFKCLEKCASWSAFR